MLQHSIDTGKLRVDIFAASACPWTTIGPNRLGKAGEECGEIHDKLLPMLARDASKYDAILTTSRVSRLNGRHWQRVQGLVDAWTPVTRQGVPVLALRDNPTADDPALNPNFCLARVSVEQANEKCSFRRADRLDRWFDAYTPAVERVPGARLVDLTRFFCDDTTCPVVVGGVNVYADNNHMTVTYAKTLGPYLLDAMRAAGVKVRG
jgi:hypothetical protein